MPKYLDFEVDLCDLPGTRPVRRFLLAERATFADLHVTIQEAAEFWTGSHLFKICAVNGQLIAGYSFDEEDFVNMSVKLSAVFGDGLDTVLYNYDFGDDWWVVVRFHGQVTDDDRFFRRLSAGSGAWPPDDCGGVPGYMSFIDEFLAGDRDTVIWADGWTPEFDFARAKRGFDLKNRPRR